MKAYNHRIRYNEINETVIDYLTKLINSNPKLQVLIEIKNTKGLSSDAIMQFPENVDIRVQGGYSQRYIENRKNVHYKSGETGEYYVDAVIYSRAELYHIVREMEEIEASLGDDWSDLEYAVALYDRLKSDVMYDPKFEQMPSSEIRSLRGLVSKKTVCAGYALMYKELLNRRGIGCFYIEGRGHAWNVIKIGENLYPVDLTWDASAYQRGNFKSHVYFGQYTEEFKRDHVPEPWSPLQGFEDKLTSVDPKMVEVIRKKLEGEKAFRTTTHVGNRSDGTRFLLAQTGNNKIGDKPCYQYFYCDIINGKAVNPMVLYSETNAQAVIHAMQFKAPYPEGMLTAIKDVLFSKENINDSQRRGTNYIGHIRDRKTKELYASPKDVPKDSKMCDIFSRPTKAFQRSDGSVIYLQQMLAQPNLVNGVKVMRYDALEVVMENGKPVVKKNTLWSESNLFKNNTQAFADDFLSRSRIDRKMEETGGYLGYFDKFQRRVYNPDLVPFFEKKSALKTENIATMLGMPTFEQLQEVTLKYTLASYGMVDTLEYTAVERNTGKVVEDKDLAELVFFAELWRGAAGVKWMMDEPVAGFEYAFNAPSREVYEWLINECVKDIEMRGFIDTVKILENSEDSSYKHRDEIIRRLFRTPAQSNFFNDFFRKRMRMSAMKQGESQGLMFYYGSPVQSQGESEIKR